MCRLFCKPSTRPESCLLQGARTDLLATLELLDSPTQEIAIMANKIANVCLVVARAAEIVDDLSNVT